MKFELELDIEQSKIYVKYLMSAMTDPNIGIFPSNSSERFENGYFLSEHSVNFEFEKENLFVNWLLKFNSNGTLNSISNINNVGNAEFELKILKFLHGVLKNVLNLKRESFFKRIVYRTISGCNFMGEYWLQGIRFAQLFPEDDKCHLLNAERLLVFEQNVEAIDDRNASEVASSNAAELSAYLSLILNVGLELPNREEMFFQFRENDEFLMQRKSTEIFLPHISNRLPSKGQLSALGIFEHSLFDRTPPSHGNLVCPVETRKILAGVKQSSEEYKDAFRRCSKLYQLALNVGRHYPTVRISYICAAVEAIVKTNTLEHKSFSDFMTKYSGENKKIHKFIYSSVRSAHWHSGSFALGEFNFDSSLMNPVNSEIRMNTLNAEYKMRFVIFNWLNEKISFTEKKDPNSFKPFQSRSYQVFGSTRIRKNKK